MNAPERDRGPRVLKHVRDFEPEQLLEFAKLEGWSDEFLARVVWWFRHGWRYFERPVPVRQFLFSRAYMRALDESGKPVLWPRVVDAIAGICEGGHIEACLTGGIGTAKTTVGLYVQAYKLYELLCHKSPHGVYGLDPTSEIVVIFQSLNKELAKGVDYERFKAMIDHAPIFSDVYFRYDRDLKSEMRFPKRVIVKPVAGVEAGALGQNVIGGILDEITNMNVIEGSRRVRDRQSYDQAVTLYNSISRRRESRFMDRGEVPGMLCLSGSRKYEDDLLHTKLAEARDKPDRIYVYDHTVWDLKPWAYGEERFRVFQGDPTRKPRLLAAGEKTPREDKHLVVSVPTELRHEFDRDLMGALRDIAGRSTMTIHPFILDRERLAEAFGRTKHCVSRTECDFEVTRLNVYPGRWSGTADLPRFAHLDLGLTRDSAGLAIGHVPHFKRIRRSQMVEEIWPVVKFDVVLEITPPHGGEIRFEKIRRLLYLLRERGMPIRWVTADSYQSTDMLQILATKGFLVGEESTDKTTGPYEVFKTALYDRRILAPVHDRALGEFQRLERNEKGKIDHPMGGSKDCSDSMACVTFGLCLQAEIWAQFGVDLRHVPDQLADAAEESSTKREVDGKVRS